jgi:hypothetical protein
MNTRYYWPHVQIRSNWSGVSVLLELDLYREHAERHVFGGAGVSPADFELE